MKPLPLLTPKSLARTSVDRDHLTRSKPVEAIWEMESCAAVVAHRGQLLVSRGGLHLLDRMSTPDAGTSIYLGRDAAGNPRIGVDLDDSGRAALDAVLAQGEEGDAEARLTDPVGGVDAADPVWMPLRDLACALDDSDVALACTLIALGNWHRTHTHSPRSGDPTEPVSAGWVREDPTAGSQHFPRTDPAVIMAVVHTDDTGCERILLGRNSQWPAHRFSLLAGFVEPGETLESAVIREVFEEAGVVVRSPAYLGSQPWPFPCSLMLGFTAEAASLDVRPDDDEITSLRWFTRDELRAAQSAREVSFPGDISIAGQIIRAWLDGEG